VGRVVARHSEHAAQCHDERSHDRTVRSHKSSVFTRI
jgi:hypothetical protein